MRATKGATLRAHALCASAWFLAPALVLGCARVTVDDTKPPAGRDDPSGGGAGTNSGGGGAGGTVSNNFADALAPPPEGEECNNLEVRFVAATPTVMLLIDRSTSMTDERYGTDTRWNVLKQAILDPQRGLLQAAQNDIRFGLATYTSTAQSGTCPDMGGVEIKLGNYAAINAYYGPLATPAIKGETPTGEAIERVTAILESFNADGPKFIVLATDGEPDSCPGSCTGNCPVNELPGYPRDPNCGHDQSVAAVQAAFRKGIRTFVIAIGGFEQVGVDHLQALANAGQGLPAVLGAQANWLQYSCNIQPGARRASWSAAAERNAPLYRPESPADLERDLKNVVNQARSCTFTLQGTITPGNEPYGTVLLDGAPLMYQDPNGYRVISANEIEILGSACQRIQESARGLRIAFPCGTFVPAD